MVGCALSFRMKRYLMDCLERMRENGHYLVEATDRAEVGEDLVGVWDRKAKVANYPAACARLIFMRKNGPLPEVLVDKIMSFIKYQY